MGWWDAIPWDKIPLFELIGSALLLALPVVVRRLAERALRRDNEFLSDYRRRLLSNLRNGLVFVVLVGMVLIWAPSLRSFALSLTAFAVAFIVATKELILCLSGAFLRAISTSFRVGQWVEVQSIRGEVIDISLLTFTLQEVYADGRLHEFTGRTVTFPNSVLLSAVVKNENFYNRYVFHRFQLTMEVKVDPGPVMESVRDSLLRDMEPHLEVAKRYNSVIERKASLDIMGVDPILRLESRADGRVLLEVTAFLPTHEVLPIEQNAVAAGLAAIREQARQLGTPKEG
jgi:small-conductance mechanosensitive channel